MLHTLLDEGLALQRGIIGHRMTHTYRWKNPGNQVESKGNNRQHHSPKF